MNEKELKKLTLAAAAGAVRRKEISPVELTRAILERISRLNERMRAFITITSDHAMKRAHAAEAALVGRGPLGPLHGVPIAVKDLFDTKGIRTTAGSKVFADRVPDRDATVIARLLRAGAILTGKLNMHEFAFGATTVNPHYGAALNPWNPEHISGGSSGGSASAIAMSMTLGTLGTDTGGSIRIPAAACGVVGFKPTFGRVSLQGAVPLSRSLDHAGPMARTVEDAALLLEIIAGYDPLDPTTRRVHVPLYSQSLKGGIRGIRIGLPKSYFFERLSSEINSAVRRAIRTMERSGARIVEIDIPDAPKNREIFVNIASPEAASFHEPYLASSRELYGGDVRERLEAGKLISAIDYVRAQEARAKLDHQFNGAFEHADVLVTPTLPIAAPRIDRAAVDWEGQAEPVLSALTRYTRVFNLAGLPTLSVPCGFTAAGMPIGLQIAGKAFDEVTVLRVAYTYEQESRWFERRPPL